MDWNWTVVRWQLLVSLELSQFQKNSEAEWEKSLHWGKDFKGIFFLHFANPNMAFVRGSPSSTPRTPNRLKVLLWKKKEQKTRSDKRNALLLKAATTTFILPVPREAKRKMVSFVPWLNLQYFGISNLFPIDEFHFRRVVRDSSSPKNQSGKNRKNYCQNVISSWFPVHEPFSGLICQWLERMSPR